MHYKIYIFIFLTFTLLVSCSSNVNKSYDKEISLAEKKEILVQKKILIKEMAKASVKIHKITWPILLANKQKCKDNKKKSYGSLFADVDDLPEEVQHIVANMMFNMGRPRLSAFKGMKAGVDSKDWNKAADEMVDSRWYKQVTNRANRLVERMRKVNV